MSDSDVFMKKLCQRAARRMRTSLNSHVPSAAPRCQRLHPQLSGMPQSHVLPTMYHRKGPHLPERRLRIVGLARDVVVVGSSSNNG
jgi:hypothetical protein